MLDALRRSVSSWITKILFVILILSFSLWSVADHIIRPPAEQPAITVGDVTISAQIVQEEFLRDVMSVRAILDNLSFTTVDAYRMGLMQQTLKRLSAKAALNVAAQAYHLTVPDEVLARSMSRNSDFQDVTGRFNRTLFQHTVESQGKSEDVYIRDLRRRLLRVQVSEPLLDAVTLPQTLMENLQKNLYEKRVADIISVPITQIPFLKQPDITTLESFYKDNAATFRTPEYRTISAIVLTISTVAHLVSIPDKAIQRAYEEALPTLRMPEIRTVEHVLFTSRERESAEAMLSSIKNDGVSLAQAASARARHVSHLGGLNRAEMEQIAPDLAEATFTAAVDTVQGPLPSAFGLHLVRVTATVPASIASLASIRDPLTEDLIAEQTGEMVYELSSQVEDAINSGASLEEAAQNVGLSVRVFSVDRSGCGKDGRIVLDLPPMQEFLQVAFTLPPGAQSLMKESMSGFFVARVDDVTPAELPPIMSIRQKLIDKWTTTQYREDVRQKAETVERLLRAGFSPREAPRIAAIRSATVSVSKQFLRTDVDAQLPPTFVPRLFGLTVGETFVDETAEEFIIGRLHAIVAPVLDESTLVGLQTDLTGEYTEDVFTQFAAAMGREFNVTINPRVLEVP